MALAIALCVPGCKGKDNGQAGRDTTMAFDSSATPGTAVRVMPHALEQAEAEAEHIQTDIDQGAWPAAEARVVVLRGLGDSLAALGVAEARRAAYAAVLDTLNAVVLSKSKPYALNTANQISRVVAAMMAAYPAKVPAAVTYLDVAGRDALYAAQQGRWNEAGHAALEAERNYADVKTHVQVRDSTLDQRVTSEIKQLQEATAGRDKNRAAGLAQALLNDVDLIEQTY